MEETTIELARADVQSWLAASRENDVAGVSKTQSFSVAAIASLGIAFEPIVSVAQALAGGNVAGGSGLYFANVPAGAHLASAKGGFIGAAIQDGVGLVGQTRFTQIPFDPATACLAVAMLQIDRKLDVIQETQKRILDYIVGKDKAADRANLKALLDTLTAYRFNVGSAEFKGAKLVEIQSIRREADKRIEHLHSTVSAEINTCKKLHSGKAAAGKLEVITGSMKDYQHVLYVYAFSTLLEVLLLGNNNPAYLGNERAKIEERSCEYLKLHDNCRNALEAYARSSVQAHLLGGASKAGKFMSGIVSKTIVGDKTLIDEAFGKIGSAAEGVRERGVERLLEEIATVADSPVRPFVESIIFMDQAYNQPVEFVLLGDELHVRQLAA